MSLFRSSHRDSGGTLVGKTLDDLVGLAIKSATRQRRNENGRSSSGDHIINEIAKIGLVVRKSDTRGGLPVIMAKLDLRQIFRSLFSTSLTYLNRYVDGIVLLVSLDVVDHFRPITPSTE